jgi:hypothetical protein
MLVQALQKLLAGRQHELAFCVLKLPIEALLTPFMFLGR